MREWKQFVGLHFGPPHVTQPPYMNELTWLTIESCYRIWEQEWYEFTAMWTVTHFETLVRLQRTVIVSSGVPSNFDPGGGGGVNKFS
jgi:hypothetical protein